MNILQSNIVLKINRLWQATGYITPENALLRMFGDGGLRAVDVVLNDDGTVSSETAIYSCEEWLKLPVREGDLSIGLTSRLEDGRGKGVAHGNRLRIPLVVQTVNYSKLPKTLLKFSLDGIYSREKGRCAYCETKLEREESTMDHVIPMSKGGPRTWDNIVLACEPCNRKKADRTPSGAGMRLKFIPKAPGYVPVTVLPEAGSPPEHLALLQR